ncbi:MAG: hypothetical protein J6A15_01665 [Clostridia bacterium]|nr:hypothetical protein [Clostridia bacterium]
MEQYKVKEFNRIDELRLALENNSITVDSISDNDVPLVTALLQYEIMKTKEKVEQASEKINDYKKRMIEAIEYLKNKNTSN